MKATSGSLGRHLRVYLIDGTPTGMLTAEIINWTGHVITAPRSRLSDLVQRPESRRAAVYFLVEPDQGGGVGTQVYVGETDDAAKRLAAHNRPEEKGGKDFWERVCVVTSKDANLTKGHIKYLESRLITVAKEAGRCALHNGTDPEYASLPEADRSDMEYFLEQIQILLPVLGFDFLRATPTLASVAASVTPGGQTAALTPVFVGDVKKHGITATGREVNGEFVVSKGSKARFAWEGAHSAYTNQFNELVKVGVLAPLADGKLREFNRDYAFSSPSAAASVVAGRTANGRTHWRVEGTDQSYGDWQDQRVTAASMQIAVPTGEVSIAGSPPSVIVEGAP
jgi:hypothetical protein